MGSLTSEAQYQYYVAAYVMDDATEGVEVVRMRRTWLPKNLSKVQRDGVRAYADVFAGLDHHDTLGIIVSPRNFKITWESAFWWHRASSGVRRDTAPDKVRFRERLVGKGDGGLGDWLS